MKYILCVDTQPQLNPSENIRKYTIEIEELRKKDDTFDTLVINNEGQIIVTRRIGILDGKTYKLDEEVTEELYNIDIELFNGVNYVYLENITGLLMTLDYVLTNDTFDSYPTMIQMNSAITQTASSIEISVNAQIEGLRVQTIKEVDVEYALSLSNQVAPTTGWNTVAPVWESGKYMWQRTKTTYGDNTVETSEPTCISGAKGDKGDTGDSGLGINSIVEYYAVSNSNSTAPDDSSFSTSLKTMTTTNKYLWNYELITYSDDSTEKTSKRVIGVYGNKGDKGDKGDTGDTGIGISNISNKYQVSASNIIEPTTWLDNPPQLTTINKYLWNYEIITYTDLNTYTTTPTVIGVYGDKGQTGDNGEDGDDGIGVTALVEQYYLSTSSSSQSGGSWKNTQDPWEKGKYIWTRNKITWTNNTTTYTTPILATGINNANEVANDTSEDLSQNYSTTVQMNAAITTKANEINSVVATKVGNSEIISKINQSSEQIAINASKIKLEGYTTINNGFAIDNNGNASIANGAVIIDNTGIKMADNTQIIGGQGLMTNLQFVGELSSQNANNMFSKFWWYDSGNMVFLSDYILINANIPSDFTIVNANIELVEHPVYWSNYSRYGYVKNIGLYEIDSNSKLISNYQTSADTYSGMVNRISNCWGENKTTNWNPSTPSDNNYGTQTVKSIDLKSLLESDSNIIFAIRSDYTKTYNQSTEQQDDAENTCFLTAILNVYGFMAFE